MFVTPIKPKNSLIAAISPKEMTRSVRFFRLVLVLLIIDILYMVYHVTSHLCAILAKYPDASHSMTLYSVTGIRTITFGISRVIVLVRRRLFRESLSKLVSGQMNPLEDWVSLRKRIKRCSLVFAGCIVFIVALNGSECVVVLRTTSVLNDIVYHLTFGVFREFRQYYSRLILIVENIFSYLLKINNLGLSFLAFVFIQTLNDRVKRFGRKIGSIETVLTKEDVVALSNSFRGIRDAVATLDDMFGVIFLFWYMDALLSAFKGIKYFLDGELGDFGHFYGVFNYFQATVVVLILTFAASNIPINLRQARSDLQDVAGRSDFDHLPMELYILLKKMNPDNASLTAAGFFIITRNACLSFIGFLVTYLIVLMSSER